MENDLSDHSSKQGPQTPHRLATLTKYLRRYRRYLVIGFMAIVASNALMLVTPYLTKLVIDRLKNHAPMSEVGLLALAMVGVAIVAGVFRFMNRRTIIWMSRWIEYDLRGELITHLLKLSPSFYDRTRTGEIMARATNDLEAVRMMIGPAVMHMAGTIVVSTGAVAMMLALSPRLTLYSLGPAIVLPIVMHRLGNLIHRKYAKIQEHFAYMTAVAQENIAGVRVVKAYRQEDEENANFGELSKKYLRLNLDLGRFESTFFPLLQTIAAFLALVVLYFGGREVIAGRIPLSTIVAFFMYLGMLTWPLIAIGWVVSLYQRGTASLDRINAVLHTTADIPLEDGGRLEKVRGKVEFRHLDFNYGGGWALSDINLTVQPGQTLGLVGPTGSGKTSLVSLLARLYPVERGQLFIDDVDINDWDPTELRRQIGFAAQEPFLFSATVAENIKFGRDDAPNNLVRETAHIADLAKDVDDFPLAYETIVGERGITLSGGQKQRAAIARAVLVDPAILVLDDATSSVDTETEHQINERIRARTSSLTTFIVSHRVASVKNADMIIYLEEGRVVEQGTHEDLIAQGGRYSELYQSQLLAQEIESL